MSAEVEGAVLYRRASEAVRHAHSLALETDALFEQVQMTRAASRACREQSSVAVKLSQTLRRLRASSSPAR